MEYRQQLLALANAFCAKTGRSEARLATIIQNQGAFFAKIRSGSGCTVDVYLKVKRWFATNWPAELEWPAGVDRPDVMPDGEAAKCSVDSVHAEHAAA